ncbi:rhomboid family intramembrane serine protease [Panacibacter ginsenosidivorans]|uniref:Rhomboid family intramembrane serine protease n=1 Tax=Panacibacter ginsenosidivorans TaxID=1813871 RepID=A0A5B8VAT6_9BACT|nr:rhomboid family intramembrane serine protease [Panacibacter ginsenosidivorans]QEC68587.1 rhomboid family intramembrane serine protease [Panacibacter ginsenosidivorans]
MTDFRPSRFQILPTIVKNLIIINVLVFAAEFVLPKSGVNVDDLFALHTWQSDLFKPWQFVTYMFMHSTDDFSHIFFNMLALWMFGSVLENVWGPKRFLTFYIVCGLGAALCHMIVLYFENQQIINDYNTWSLAQQQYYAAALQDRLNTATIGASGAVFGCLAAFGYLFPNDNLYVMGLIPIKAKWLVIIYAGVELFSAVQNSAGDTVAHVAHLGGALAGFLMVYFWNKTNKKTFY